MEIEEGVIRRGRRPRRITPSENSIILHVIRKPNDYVTDYVTDEESLIFLKCLFHGTSFDKRRSKFIEPLTGNNRAIDSKKTHTHTRTMSTHFMAMKNICHTKPIQLVGEVGRKTCFRLFPLLF